MTKKVIVKFDGSIRQQDGKTKSAGIGYEVYHQERGKILSTGSTVYNRIDPRKPDTVYVEYCALLEGIERTIETLDNPSEHALQVQGDCDAVINCVDHHSSPQPKSRLHQKMVNQIRDCMDVFRGRVTFDIIPSEHNSAHHNANSVHESRNL